MHEARQWGEEIPPKEVVNPIVFHFRPNKFLEIDAKHRAEWERFFQENVGFPPRAAAEATPGRALARYINGGISGSNGGWDD
jgi:hypothetical protein